MSAPAARLALPALVAAALLAAGAPVAASESRDGVAGTSCGDRPHEVESLRPEGDVLDLRPVIEVVFHDADEVCGVVAWGIEIDGVAVATEIERLGGFVILRHQPTLPLTPGRHHLDAWVREACCDSSGSPGGGIAQWDFTVLAQPGEPFRHDLHVPGVALHTRSEGVAGVPLPAPVSAHVGTSPFRIRLHHDPEGRMEPIRIPVLDLTAITICPEDALPCPSPFQGTGAGPVTVTFGFEAGAVAHEREVTVPLVP